MSDALRSHPEVVKELRQELRYPEGASGIAVAINGKTVGIDLFDQPETLEVWDRLVVLGLTLDALDLRDADRQGTTTRNQSGCIWSPSGRCVGESFPRSELGKMYRATDSGSLATALVVDGMPSTSACRCLTASKETDMGLTIHYRLQCDTRDDAKVRRLVEELRKRALDLPFAEVGEVAELDGDRCDLRTYEGNDPLRWLAVQAGQLVEHDGTYHRVQPTAIVAFTTWPGEGCEAANFGLAVYPKVLYLRDPIKRQTTKLETGLKGWCWGSFCKTEYASQHGIDHFLRCHLCVVRMLDHAKQLGILAWSATRAATGKSGTSRRWRRRSGSGTREWRGWSGN